MTADGTRAAALADALAGAALVATDPAGLGGMLLRGGAREVGDLVVAELLAGLPAGAPVRRLPGRVDDSRLTGGLDLVATLAAGRPVHSRGLLAETDGGLIVVPMAERLAPLAAACLAAALDSGSVPASEPGAGSEDRAARLAVVALDEGEGEDPSPPAALTERLAIHVNLAGIRLADVPVPDDVDTDSARRRLPAVVLDDADLAALAEAADALGVHSPRVLVMAARAACVSAALAGRAAVSSEDLAIAARLVLGPRATMIPVDAPPPPPPPPPPPEDGETPDAEATTPDGPLADVVLEAAKAAVPPALLALASAGLPVRSNRNADGRGQKDRASLRGGRPLRSRPGRPGGGARLDLVETLRAAAPMQRLRPPPHPGAAVAVRPADLRVRRFRRRSRTTTVFVVDASGSSALHRLAEAKGAVELVLGDCYVRRDRVALIAFRGTGAETILPPTSSLTRAKRLLADLPAGGGTPLAAAVDAASAMAGLVRERGETPLVVFLTDGQANVGRDGTGGRARAEADALAAAGMLRATGVSALVLDIAARPDLRTQRFAEALGATYLPLPRADAGRLATAVRMVAPGRGS